MYRCRVLRRDEPPRPERVQVEEPRPSPPLAREPAAPGPGPDDPVEGTAEDLELEALGIPRVDPPSSRRRRRRLERELLHRANQLRRDGEYDAAVAAYHELLGMFPENARGAAGLARTHRDRDAPADAIPFAQRLVHLRPRLEGNWLFLGDVLRDAGNRPAARRAYERALELSPDAPSARRRLAELDAP